MQRLMEPENHATDGRFSVDPAKLIARRAYRWLSSGDRAILDLSAAGASRRMIAKAIGVHPGNVTRRLASLRTRLTAAPTRALISTTCPLPDETRMIAAEYFIGGQTMRHIARSRQLTLHAVQRHLDSARGMLRIVTRRGVVRVT